MKTNKEMTELVAKMVFSGLNELQDHIPETEEAFAAFLGALMRHTEIRMLNMPDPLRPYVNSAGEALEIQMYQVWPQEMLAMLGIDEEAN